ncbi:TIGR00297 family protein [Thermosynechococcus sp. PP42]|uniref:TIGR00297 family protein n=1 Tax=Thermosynechococcus sp. PP42 TaxID=3074083 RepID=UPI0037DD7717
MIRCCQYSRSAVLVDGILLLNPWWIGILLNTVLGAIALLTRQKLLTLAGLFHAWLLGVLIWGTLGWQGYLIVMVYFLVGSAVTRIGMVEKEAAGIAEKRAGARGPENVWGSAFTGTLCALLALLLPQWRELFLVGFVASFSTKLSDTCASEVGKAYGQRTFLITTLQPVPRGTEGAVSLEGTLAGLIGATVIAALGWSVGLMGAIALPICILAAFLANLVESLVGATLQERYTWLSNEIVNGINTTVGALVAMVAVFIAS